MAYSSTLRMKSYWKSLMIKTYGIGSVLLLASVSAHAGCWVVENVKGSSASQFNQYDIRKDGFADKVFVVNIDKNSPSVSDSLMTYTVMSPTAMVGTYATELGLTIQTWQISTDQTKAFVTLNRTNTNSVMQDAVASFVGDVKAKCDP